YLRSARRPGQEGLGSDTREAEVKIRGTLRIGQLLAGAFRRAFPRKARTFDAPELSETFLDGIEIERVMSFHDMD
ncbi:hypothetical protein ACC708_36170, partial [Rhizobium ruizarguesonis]